MEEKSEIIERYVRAFPDAPSRMLARMIYRDHKESWTNEETVRTAVRYIRGNSGNKDRTKRINIKKTGLFRPNGKTGDPFVALPEPLTTLKDWGIYELKTEKCLVLADLHIPFYDKKALSAAVKHGKKSGIDTIILNGDIMDFFSISRFQPDPQKRNFPQEIEYGKWVLDFIRNYFKNAKIVYKIANHEERLRRYMGLKAPELLGVQNFEFSNIFKLNDLGIEIIEDRRPIKTGILYIIHGHEFGKCTYSPVNPARTYFLKAKDHVLVSHLHQISEHPEPRIGGQKIGAWSTGCLCELHPEYAPLNKWMHGFAIVEVRRGGEYRVNNYKIIEGEIY